MAGGGAEGEGLRAGAEAGGAGGQYGEGGENGAAGDGDWNGNRKGGGKKGVSARERKLMKKHGWALEETRERELARQRSVVQPPEDDRGGDEGVAWRSAKIGQVEGKVR